MDDEGRLVLRVTPGARTEALEIAPGLLLVRVRAKARNGEANEAVLALLSRALGMATSRLRMLRGATVRDKWVQVG
jgi:uncharacterized protein YggU (UPF0235/DUF167 family)